MSKFEEAKTKLKFNPHTYFYVEEEDKEISSIHNSFDNAVCMLIEMQKYSDNVSLDYDQFAVHPYKVKLKF